MIGSLRHVVMFQSVALVPDGDGGVVETWTDIPPAWAVRIQPANVRDLERQTAGTTVATATHVVHGRYRADVNVEGRMKFGDRIFRIMGIVNPEERGIEMYLFCVETL